MSPAGRMEFCPEGEPSREDLRRELAAQDLGEVTLERIEPGIEDLFMHLMG